MSANIWSGENSRRHSRIQVALKVELTLEDSGVIFAKTRDISEGGIFLILDQDQMPAMGDVVRAQIKNLPGQAETPVVSMKVVRVTPEGIGLCILEE